VLTVSDSSQKASAIAAQTFRDTKLGRDDMLLVINIPSDGSASKSYKLQAHNNSSKFSESDYKRIDSAIKKQLSAGNYDDAVAAMERSTQGVVRGAKLSDEAGMALIGIGQVSQELADLIMRISRTTENQAASASSVAQSIQRILLVNSQTNEGTQQTAGSILQLSELARELKNSVARFRVG